MEPPGGTRSSDGAGVRGGDDRPTGAVGGALVVMGLVALLLGLLILIPPGAEPRMPVRAALQDILEEGPVPGRWRVETIDGVGTWHVQALADDDACVLVAEENEEEEIETVQRWSKWKAASEFAPGDAALFFRNYRLREEPLLEGSLVIATWVPRHDLGGDTARTIWMDADSGAVVHLEDQTYLHGDIIRSLDRQGEAALLEPPEPAGTQHVCPGRMGGYPRPSAARVAALTPFVLLAPRYLPPGFQLVQAGYYSMDVVIDSVSDEENQKREIHVAYLTYSDGLALIGLAVARPEDMEAFEAWQAQKPHNPDACPTLPRSGGPVKTEGLLIRRRYSRCRTVLRLDASEGVSVTLIARNELPQDEYVDMIASVVPVEPSPAGKREPATPTHDE